MKHAPKAEEIVHIRNIHGKTLKDPWFWVREKESERVQALLRSENSYVDSEMADTLELQESLYNEMIGRIKETDTSVPVKRDDYFYYSRTVKGLQYSIYCRKLFSMEAPEEILLDCNTLAEGRPYFNLGSIAVSPDHKRMAYAIDVTGAESYTIFIKDVTTGMLLPDQIDNSGGSICWAKDSNTFFYNILDKAKRPFKIFRHSVGTPPEKDALIFHEKDESFFVSVHKSKDRQYIFITLKSNTTSEAYFLEASRPQDKLKLVQKRCPKMEYFAEHQEGRFIILTNWKAQNFRLMSAPVETSSREHWHEIIAHRPEVKLDDFDVYRGRLVIYERENGLTRIRIQEEDTEPYFIAFPETVYTAWDDTNPDYEAESVRYGYTSMVTPRSIFEYDFKTRKSTLLKETEVQGGYDKAQYVTERLYVKSHDGTEIPMSAVYRRDLDRSRSARLFLYGYGSYGITVHPEFSSIRLSLLDRGYVFVIAHIRGGGYLGRPWYESGKLLNKKNTFEDFIACSRYLIDRGWTEPEKMVICGGSAGGLLIGAALNAAPELFGAAIAQVPFVDVINTMLDPSLPLTVMEYEEWGNPNEKEYFDYIHSYSPYDNVLKRAYPEILVMTGVNDPRVQYWEPLKWVQKLRAHNTGNKKVLLKINMGAGHGGASGRYDYLREIAFEYAFVISRIGGETDGALHREKGGRGMSPRKRKARHNIIAIVFDFDGTLSPNNMQEDTIFREYRISKDALWRKADRLVKNKGYERTLAYLKLLIHDPVFKKKPLKKLFLKKMASKIAYFPGVEDFFSRMRDFVNSQEESRRWNIILEFYVISSGMKEILEGTALSHEFKRIYACEYEYGPAGPVFPKIVINDTNKIQFLFRINKGKLDLSEDINSHMPDEQRRIPFSNMIYIGDSVTDIPSMVVTKRYGGCSIGVFNPSSRVSPKFKALVRERRVDQFAPADYRAGQLLERIVKTSLKRIVTSIAYTASSELSRNWVRRHPG